MRLNVLYLRNTRIQGLRVSIIVRSSSSGIPSRVRTFRYKQKVVVVRSFV